MLEAGTMTVVTLGCMEEQGSALVWKIAQLEFALCIAIDLLLSASFAESIVTNPTH